MSQKMPILATWRKSTASASTNCVEVSALGNSILVRNTKDRSGPTVAFTTEEWNAFIIGVRDGEFDVPVLQSLTTDR